MCSFYENNVLCNCTGAVGTHLFVLSVQLITVHPRPEVHSVLETIRDIAFFRQMNRVNSHSGCAMINCFKHVLGYAVVFLVSPLCSNCSLS